ncbi:MAG: long-chain fatty acid--CoA ligase [Rhodocyclaceae bacterium]|nr:long-chain fatty acid--CoA ligase [Rhodocyclaceae bacterium]
MGPQTLNLPGADRPGSAGRPLPHARVRVDARGELMVAGALALGYIGQAPAAGEELATGDIGHIDAEGFVWVRGRRDNLIITGLGRNVSPEWVESCLRESPCIAQAVVLPDGTGALQAVVWPAADASDDDLDRAVARANRQLPDYARVGRCLRARRPLDAANGLATPGGKPLRGAIATAHAGPADAPKPTPHQQTPA